MAHNEGVRVYITSISSNKNIMAQQNRIESVLKAKGIDFQWLDLAGNPTYKDEMREIMGDPTAVPPQIFNGQDYCGDYESFREAVDDGRLLEFLKLNKS